MEPVYFPDAAALRAWLERHHADADELEVGYWRLGVDEPSVTYPESLDEALCFGWIDGVRHRVDERRYSVRFTPRRPGSRWSRVNVEKARALVAAGRMEPAGLAAFEARRERTEAGGPERTQGTVDELEPGLQALLDADEAARTFFLEQSASVRRRSIAYVMAAKKAETRRRRMEGMLEKARERERWW